MIACSPAVTDSTDASSDVVAIEENSEPISARGYVFPPAPEVPEGELATATSTAVDRLVASAETGLDFDALETVSASGDARLAWVVADLLRFLQGGRAGEELVQAFEVLTDVDLAANPTSSESPWGAVTDHLIAWDLPAPPGYQGMKRELFLLVEPGWSPFFGDADANIDWRWVSWGGVLIDDRPLGDGGFCDRGCIPALDDPALTDAMGGDWYSDGSVVFGVVVDGQAVAFPKNMMEIHELVNITIGGRRLGIPYCTLCGSAQAYFLDSVASWDQPIVLRTSGLLSRSNKVMYDLNTESIIDTFTGVALSGPLQDAAVTLEQTTVVGSFWGDWKTEHPDTMIVARDGGIGRSYPDDPLQGRDAAGPIFPVGDVDPRLAAQTLVVGVIGPDGLPLAFPIEEARSAMAEGKEVTLEDIRLLADGSGFRAELLNGNEVVAHQAFWFAWSHGINRQLNGTGVATG
ncbi:MAG: DUF3179 domain-containing protein [Actinobacteria bacterium]|nr:DUF3179 domain-containing protein [Actinomycetota bacterium]